MNGDPHRVLGDAAGATAVDQFQQHQLTAPLPLFQSRYALVDWALAYASRGLHVFPLHSMRGGRGAVAKTAARMPPSIPE